MRWLWTLATALRSALSPTLGVNPHEPALAQALHAQPWLVDGRFALRGAAAAGLGLALGASLTMAAVVAAGWPASEVALLLALATRVLVDGLALARSAGRLGADFRSGRWDLLRLTAQGEGALLRAHYAAAHAAVWRALLLALGLQSGALVAMALLEPVFPSAGARLERLGMAGAVCLILGVELLLRPRAVAAIGLALSASAPRAGTALVLGGGALLVAWACQAAAALVGVVAVMFVAAFLRMVLPDFILVVLVLFAVVLPPVAVLQFLQGTALHRLALAIAERDTAV